MFKSKLRVVSIGVAAENKALDSHELAITPIELVPGVDGDLMEALTETEVFGVDKNGTDYSVLLNTSSTLTARWLPWGSNRVTSPDVRRGEHLLIWQYADVDRYYWSPMGIDDDLRRLETVIYAWSATSEEAQELNLIENMYSLEVSTHGKHITLHTTQANGEPFEYTLQLDTDKGKFFLTDQVGNTVTLDSAKTQIQAINKDMTEVTLEKTRLYGYAKDKVRVRSDDVMQASSGGDMLHYVEGNLNQYVGGDWNVMCNGNKTEVVLGNAGHYHAGGHTVLSDGAVALDGVGVNFQAGMAPVVDTGAIPDGTKGPEPAPEPAPTDEDGNPVEAPEPIPLSKEYGIKSTSAVRDKAGRYAVLDEEGESGSIPSFYPEDSKPAGYTGKALTVSPKQSTEKPTGTLTSTTEVGVKVDYSLPLGSTNFTIGDLSANAVFAHLIKEQGGLTAQDIVSNLEYLAEKILQPLEDEFGAFTINSGFRVGSGTSQHTRGQAVDIQGAGWTPQKYMEVAEWIAENLPCDQLIFEHGNSIWLHVSFDPSKENQRGQLLTMLNGNYEPGLKNYYA